LDGLLAGFALLRRPAIFFLVFAISSSFVGLVSGPRFSSDALDVCVLAQFGMVLPLFADLAT
jgi:hypothetical protein